MKKYKKYLSEINGIEDILKATDNLGFQSVLDVGFGQGFASIYFSEKGKNVTSIGLALDKYYYPKELMNNLNIKIYESSLEDFSYIEQQYDAIWMSHVLEHTRNPGKFLDKAYSLLDRDGWLMLLVPPYKSDLVGGHVSSGWNIGQLIYNLILSGFNVKDGHYIKYGYSVVAFVQKSTDNNDFSFLTYDTGDINLLKEYLPINIYEGMNGHIKSINWFENFFDYAHLDLFNKDEFNLKEKNEAIINMKKKLKEKNEAIINMKKKLKEKDESLKVLREKLKEKDESLKVLREKC